MTDKTKTRLSRKDLFHVGQILSPVIEEDPGPADPSGQKYVRYKDEWSDARVAAVAGITVHQAALARRDLFGNLRAGLGAIANTRELAERCAALERKLADMERRLSMIEEAVTKPKGPVKAFADLPRALSGKVGG